MKELNCLRCGRKMTFFKQEKIQLGQTGYFLGDWPNLLAGALEVEIYGCPNCGKIEFFTPGLPELEQETPDLEAEELPPEVQQNIVGISRDGIPQIQCPACGRKHDFDYPQCPYCDHPY